MKKVFSFCMSLCCLLVFASGQTATKLSAENVDLSVDACLQVSSGCFTELSACSSNVHCTAATNKLQVESQLTIMSFNIRYDEPRDGEHNWRFRRQAAVDMILDQKVDVVGIQEGLEHQVAYLDSALIGFKYVGVGRDSKDNKGNEFSALFFKTSRFELLDSGTQWLSETPTVPSKGWDASLNRIYTWAQLKDKTSNKELLVINTHFDHRGEVARHESAKLIAKVVKELSEDYSVLGSNQPQPTTSRVREQKNIPVFVVGDFNAVPDDPLFAPIYNCLQSAQQTAPITDHHGTFNAFKEGYEGSIIDYIFYRNATPLRYETVRKNYGVQFVSDHYPVVSVLVF